MNNPQLSPITITALRWVPPPVRGFVRDLRVRWALEEADLPYTTELIGPRGQASAQYRNWQPFGQVPAYKQGGLELFESGAIVLHIAERSPALMPASAAERARVQTWMFAALNSIEPCVQQLADIDLFHKHADWAQQRRPEVYKAVDARIAALAAWLGASDYLESRFTAGDLLMASVLRNLCDTDLLSRHPAVKDYTDRCEARPAFKKALQAQLNDFAEDSPEASA